MNFTNRDNNTQSAQQTRSNSGNSSVNVAGPLNNALKGRKNARNWMKGTFAVMLVSLTIITLGTVYLLHSNPSEAKYVNGKTLQAVFLQNGQVYFGHIKSISQKYVELQNIFYLNNPSANSTSGGNTNSSTLSLVKLGCELHGPTDRMIINQDQVTYWENIRTDGKVAKAVAQYNQKYPNGQTCDDSNSTNSTSQAAGAQNPTDASKKQ